MWIFGSAALLTIHKTLLLSCLCPPCLRDLRGESSLPRLPNGSRTAFRMFGRNAPSNGTVREETMQPCGDARLYFRKMEAGSQEGAPGQNLWVERKRFTTEVTESRSQSRRSVPVMLRSQAAQHSRHGCSGRGHPPSRVWSRRRSRSYGGQADGTSGAGKVFLSPLTLPDRPFCGFSAVPRC